LCYYRSDCAGWRQGRNRAGEPVQESLDEETQRACYRAGMGKPMTNYNELVSIIISLSAAYLEFFLFSNSHLPLLNPFSPDNSTRLLRSMEPTHVVLGLAILLLQLLPDVG
jgi:hypothetical protein